MALTKRRPLRLPRACWRLHAMRSETRIGLRPGRSYSTVAGGRLLRLPASRGPILSSTTRSLRRSERLRSSWSESDPRASPYAGPDGRVHFGHLVGRARRRSRGRVRKCVGVCDRRSYGGAGHRCDLRQFLCPSSIPELVDHYVARCHLIEMNEPCLNVVLASRQEITHEHDARSRHVSLV